jgi:pyrrolysine biosynthesis protein PylC
MRILVLGGRLQGIEAIYLCNKACYESILIDKDPQAPAKTLADEFYILNIKKNVNHVKRILKKVDVVLPACENTEVLRSLEKLCDELDVPFMQDNNAFCITSDKQKSTQFFTNNSIPIPISWPDCGFPVIVKPSSKSGSESVFRANTNMQLEKAIERTSHVDQNIIIQEFVEGLALSIEVIANSGKAKPLQITGLEFDETYGCKRVFVPVSISTETKRRFKKISIKIAEGLKLNGLTDVQAILNEKGDIKVNEINARLPSQTPTAVYQSSDTNMIKLLTKLFLENTLPKIKIHPSHAVIYQHIKISNGELKVQGEHIIGEAEGLQLLANFYGADEAITNLKNGRDNNNGVATIIVRKKRLGECKKKMNNVIQRIIEEYRLTKYNDPIPNVEGVSWLDNQ